MSLSKTAVTCSISYSLICNLLMQLLFSFGRCLCNRTLFSQSIYIINVKTEKKNLVANPSDNFCICKKPGVGSFHLPLFIFPAVDTSRIYRISEASYKQKNKTPLNYLDNISVEKFEPFFAVTWCFFIFIYLYPIVFGNISCVFFSYFVGGRRFVRPLVI